MANARPPLPPKPRALNRSRKQREREEPDVDWEASLQHFAAAVSDDLDDLHAKFLQQDEATFAVWKRLWADARMSAAFHVEFWESSPTNTHKTILQQALDALVSCIEEKDGEFESSMDVVALVGRVFALYCAYSVQLGRPKHKIDVDPRSWTALLTINCVMCRVGKTLHPTASREVRAMMLRLEVEENAFLRCLQGFGPSVRVRGQPLQAPDAEASSNRSFSLTGEGEAAAENYVPVQGNTVKLLKSLGGHYQQLMRRARSAETSVGGRRGKAALSAKLPSNQEPGNDADELTRALKSYMEYKANEETRRNDRAARTAAVREYESQMRLEQTSRERDDSSNLLELSDRDSVLSAPPRPKVRTTVSTGLGSHSRRSSGDSEDFLAELESELNAGVSSSAAKATASSESFNRRSSSVSEISEADSDALADLERELEQSAELVPSQAKEKDFPARPKRGREAPATGIVPRKSARVAGSTQARTPSFTTDSAKRARNNSVPSRLSRSRTATSAAHSDGLADIQAELEAVPSLSVSAEVSSAAIQSIMPLSRLSTLSSVVSEADSDALEDLERELSATAATLEPDTQPPIAGKQRTVASSKPAQRPTRRNTGKQRLKTVATSAVPAAVQPTAQTALRGTDKQQAASRESTRIGSVLSDAESDGLAELVAELGTTIAAQINPPVQRRQKHPAKTTKRSSATRKRVPNAVISRLVGSKAPTRSLMPATGLRRSSRLSSVASDTESDGLEDLLAELESTPKTLPVNSKKPKARAATTKTTTKAKAPRTPRAPRQKKAPLKHPAAGNTAVAPQPVSRLSLPSSRRSTRSNSIAVGSESDGLAELEAELQAAL